MDISYCEMDNMKCVRFTFSDDFLLYMTEVDVEFLVDIFDRLLKIKGYLLDYNLEYKITHKYNYKNDNDGGFDLVITFQTPINGNE